MTILCDRDIRQLVVTQNLLSPFSEAVDSGGVISFGLTSAGYDLRLGDSVLIFKNSFNQIISPKRMKSDPSFNSQVFDSLSGMEFGRAVLIPPAPAYILGYSLEYIRIPRWLKGRCVGKSSMARCGILVNTTPLEPGWEGHLTIEIANVTPCPAEIYVGEGICQLELETLTNHPETDYAQKRGKYQSQMAQPVPAKVKE